MQLLENRAAKTYWIGTTLQMFTVCFIIAVFRFNQIQYPGVLGLLFLIVGGASSAIWGIIVSVKFKCVNSGFKILKDFFNIKQSPLHYSIVVFFILVIFGTQVIRGHILDGVRWYSFFILFIQSIIFGGIEEIGWRYTWQPMIEKRVSFELACIFTFVSWLLWHYMYFYITNSLVTINHASFLMGLLGSCFVLGAIYRISNSLWLCVFYHCLLNVFFQTLYGNSLKTVVISNGICIVLSVFMVRTYKPLKM